MNAVSPLDLEAAAVETIGLLGIAGGSFAMDEQLDEWPPELVLACVSPALIHA
jgi:hypothetical protein